MTVEGLVKALHGAGFDTHPDHLLDALWLGSLGRDLATIEIPTTDTNVRPTPNGDEGDHETPDGHGRDDRKDADSAENDPKDFPASKPPDGETSPVYGAGDVAAEDVTIPAAGIILPSARTLPDRLPLIRAMRPFRRQFPSHAIELDEVRTAELTAEMRAGVDGSVFPVLRPRYERWYEAHVVVEDDPIIELWTAPLREFTQVLRDAGAFRLIRSWRLHFNSSAPSDLGKARLESPARGLSSPGSLGSARQLIFFASHGLSPRWVDGTYARLLGSWSASSVVLLHLQPRSRWSQTMLGEPQALAHSLQPGSPNATLDIETFWWRPGPDPDNMQVVRLPAIAIEPASLELWARTLMGLGRQTETFLLDPAATWTDYPADTPASKEEDVLRALATLVERSVAAYDLAIMLASAPFTLPVARLVQEVTQDGDTNFTVLAELMLSGIVVPRAAGDTVARETTYFMIREQARPLLLRSLRGADADALARSLDERISKHLSNIVGRTIQFAALIAHPEGRAKLPIWAQEFAHITSALDPAALRNRLQGLHESRAQSSSTKGRMEDTTVYFATNRMPDSASPGGFGSEIITDPTLVSYAVVPVSNVDLNNADGGQLGAITALTPGNFAPTIQAEIETTGKNLLVFIHGFDNSFESAIKRSAFNREWFAASGVPEADTTVVAFTWPSGGELFGSLPDPPDAAYRHDQGMAGRSSAHLPSFLRNVLTLVDQTRRAGKRAFLLAHSMGNHALAAAIAGGGPPGGVTYNEAILAAADEDYTTLQTRNVGMYRLRDLADRISVYSSRRDLAMDLSRVLNRNRRLGFNGPADKGNPLTYIPATVRSVDCTDVYDFFGLIPFDATHQYYRRSRTLRGDITKLMAGAPVAPGVSSLSAFVLGV